MPRQLRVFLCHASQDKPAVRELYKRLKKEEWIDPWLDKAKILPGQDWEIIIEKAVEASDVVIVCLSSHSISKEGFVQREIRYAYDIALEKPDETIFLIPLRLDDCAVPRKLRTLHWVDFFGGEKDSSYFDLLEALKTRYDQIKNLNPIDQEPAQDSEENAKPNKWQEENDLSSQKGETNRRLPVFAMGLFSFFIISLLVWGMWVVSNQDNLPIQTSNESLTSTHQITVASPTSSPAVTPTFGIGSTMISEKDGMVMVYVPAGEFTMGSNDGKGDEKPEHSVDLDAFWIDQTEVTNVMYAKCVANGGCTPPSSTNSYTHDSYYGNSDFDDYPVIYVNWNQANAYCSWAGRKLPTEAEWEKATRGTDGRTYPWGEEISCNIANYYDGRKYCVDDTSKVGTYPSGASIYGALDMAGNVWEWVSTLYQDYPYNATDGREDLTASGSRVLRGGAWDINGYNVRSALRYGVGPAGTSNSFGFRCSLSHP